MVFPAGPTARRALSICSSLLLTVAMPVAVSAQGPSPIPSPAASPVAEAERGAPAAAASAPEKAGRLTRADYPKAGLGMSINDVIEGGPGYIAVGGGTPTGLDHRALVWLSEDGQEWQPVPLFGEAAVGTINGVAALPNGGYVAVGRDFVPETERADLVHALVWYSEDGFRWELTDGLELAPFSIAADGDGDIVVGGVDDGYDISTVEAAVAGSADGWSPQVLMTPQSDIGGISASGDGFLAAGSRWIPGGPLEGSALHASDDGLEWGLLKPEGLEGIAAFDIAGADGLVVLVGLRSDKKNRLGPVALWSTDLGRFTPLRLPHKFQRNGTTLAGVRLVDDGSLAFVFGEHRGRPAIWTASFEP